MLFQKGPMEVVKTSEANFILLSGIEVPHTINLSGNVELQTADTSHLDLDTALLTCSQPDDMAVVIAFIPRTTAQLQITAKTSKEVAIISWNSFWDAILLSAVFNTEVGFNLQSDTSSNKITAASNLCATNYGMRGLTKDAPYTLTPEDMKWISIHFNNAQEMLNDENFQTAVHSLASYRWHTVPRIKMAVIWAGIEGLFRIDSEIRFRISLYIARFLHPNNADERQKTFDIIKRLYNTRSKAVHGSKIKGDISASVEASSDILRKLIIRCIENNSLPDENELAP